MTQPTYIIGIDLGTTNSTVAYTLYDSDDKPKTIEQFPINQLIAQNQEGTSFSLPSFVYFPLAEEMKAKSKQSFLIGTYAKDRGAELPSRLILSSKSWLCHAGINRREKILPLNAESDQLQMSPLSASAEILRHIKDNWNKEHPEHPFVQQQILITVPASFDPSARQLVQEAAELAEFPEVVLLEEPQAAFYAWLNTQVDNWRKILKVDDSVLVIDIGGGTTDFSLIRVEQEEGNLTLKREAVGSHLLLGGDNIDLTLAYLVKQKLEDQGHAIDDWQLQSLIHQCRKAKEELLGLNPPKTVKVTILGRGSKLIGNTLSADLTKEEIQKLIIDGFIPLINSTERPLEDKKSGLQQIGLPFVQDPRISAQLAKFLGEVSASAQEPLAIPTAILFNGGTLKAPALRKQIVDVINGWAKELKKPEVIELPDADYDFAVSQGAVNYGLARIGKAVRIRGGVSRAYFIGIEDAVPAVPGISPPLTAICIVPFGMEEGDEKELSDRKFVLTLGELATFRFFSHSGAALANGEIIEVGTPVRNWKKVLDELHPIETLLDKGNAEGKTAQITLKSRVTELGVLELWCAADDGRKWKLEFDIRN